MSNHDTTYTATILTHRTLLAHDPCADSLPLQRWFLGRASHGRGARGREGDDDVTRAPSLAGAELAGARGL
jgi:hypothetical protein